MQSAPCVRECGALPGGPIKLSEESRQENGGERLMGKPHLEKKKQNQQLGISPNGRKMRVLQ